MIRIGKWVKSKLFIDSKSLSHAGPNSLSLLASLQMYSYPRKSSSPLIIRIGKLVKSKLFVDSKALSHPGPDPLSLLASLQIFSYPRKSVTVITFIGKHAKSMYL